ncbi:hypothetical protein Tco_1340228, partial [Tanacetum coccineum]
LELCEYPLLKAFDFGLGWFTIGVEAAVLILHVLVNTACGIKLLLG